jgi:hypothetical protein
MIAYFCIAQLGAIAAGYLCAFRAVTLRARLVEMMGMANELPTGTEFIANYGWALVVIPIACVFMIPRQRDDEDEGSVKWRWPSHVVMGLSALAFIVPVVGVGALLTNFMPVRTGIIYRDPDAAKKGSK